MKWIMSLSKLKKQPNKNNSPYKGRYPTPYKGRNVIRLQGVKGFSSEPPPYRHSQDTGPPGPHRRSTQVAGTSEQVVLLTRPRTKISCQHPSTKMMHTSVHPGVLWEEPHQTQSINDDRRGPSLYVDLDRFTGLNTLPDKVQSPDSLKLTVTHFLHAVYLRRIF